MSVHHQMYFEGLAVELYRSKFDGQIVVDIETCDLSEKDNYPDDACPKFRIIINEADHQVTPDDIEEIII